MTAIPPSSASRRRPSLQLASAALFGEQESPILAAFDSDANRIVLRGGETLFRQGERGDALYVVTYGSLEVVADGEGAVSRRLDVIGRGGSVGEMALLVDEPRSATVRAIRDSEVVRVDKAAFDKLLVHRPQVAVELARTLVRRLRRTTTSPHAPRRPRTVALLGTTHDDLAPIAMLASTLAQALSHAGGREGTAMVVTAGGVERALGQGASQLGPDDEGGSRVLEWLAALEDAHAFVLFQGAELDSVWTARCVRQADLVLVVARAADDGGRAAVEHALAVAPGALARRELVLLHDERAERPVGTARWLGAPGVVAHHHVRPERTEDVRRLARAIAGRSVGVVLSGGGARGFAHIGVLRALQESGYPVDLVGGTSMGAIVAAQWAAGYDIAQMTELCRRHYSGEGGTSDRTVPIAAFSSARQTVRKLKAMFGDWCIEDLWTRYFCVTASLTSARTLVHESGPLWLWTRVSCAIPGLAPPVEYGGELLADGGILDNLPVATMRERCGGPVIASDVSVPIDLRPIAGAATRAVLSGWPLLWERMNPLASAPPSFPSIVEIMQRTALLGSVRDSHAAGRQADLYLRPPIDEFGMTSFRAIDQLIDIGYRYARERIDEWRVASIAGPG